MNGLLCPCWRRLFALLGIGKAGKLQARLPAQNQICFKHLSQAGHGGTHTCVL